MATTITTQPNAVAQTNNLDYVQPAYSLEGLFYVITSNTADIIGIRIKVFVDGSEAASLDREPTLATISAGNKEFEFDISTVIQDYLSYNLQQSVITAAASPNTGVPVYIEAYEITSVAGVVDVSLVASDTSNDIRALNIARDYGQDNAQSFGLKYVLSEDSPSATQFITTAPYLKEIGMDEQETIALLRNKTLDAGDKFELQLTQFDGDWNFLTGFNDDASSTELEGDWGAGTRNIINYGVSIHADTVYYTISGFFFDDSASLFYMTEIRAYKIVSRVCEDKERFHFLTPFGKFDSVTFEAAKENRQDIKSLQYQKHIHPTFSNADRGIEEFQMSAQDVHRAWLDYKHRDVIQPLKYLYASPQVYIEREDELGNALFFPVIITNKEAWKFNSQNVGRLSIKYFIAIDRETQRN